MSGILQNALRYNALNTQRVDILIKGVSFALLLQQPCHRSAVRINPGDQLAQHFFRLMVLYLAGAGILVPAAAKLQHQFADVGL